jgi:hypothetical protein
MSLRNAVFWRMIRRVARATTEVSKKRIAYISRVTIVGDL